MFIIVGKKCKHIMQLTYRDKLEIYVCTIVGLVSVAFNTSLFKIFILDSKEIVLGIEDLRTIDIQSMEQTILPLNV